MLITPEYVKEQKKLHLSPDYGNQAGQKHAYLVAGIALLEDCELILDYGCGKGTLKKELDRIVPCDYGKIPFECYEYDPAIPGKDFEPSPANLVVCLDVMEHIEPQCLDDVIKHIKKLTLKFLFVDVSTKFTHHYHLSDGRNAHLIVNDDAWWKELFTRHGFKVLREWNTGIKAWVALMEKC